MLSAIEVIFGAKGEVAPGERIVTPEPDEAIPYEEMVRRMVKTRKGWCLTTILFRFDFNGAAAGRGGIGGAELSPLYFTAVTLDVDPLGWTDEGGVEAP